MEKKLICVNCMKPLEPGTEICPECACVQNGPYPQKDLVPGTVLQDRYFVGKSLYTNGEGISYAAYDLVSEARVTVKEFFPGNLCSREQSTAKVVPDTGNESRFRALMLDYVDLAKMLTRSRSLTAVIPVLDVFEENNTVYMISQYVETITLKDYLMMQGGELSWDRCKTMFALIISALNTIHSTASMYHLGLSPETILVDKNEQLKLSGFAIEALRTAKSDLLPELAAGYAAPEQYNSANWIGPWTDVYAIAAVMYKCLTGTMPPESTGRVMGETLLPANKLVKDVPINISNILFKSMNISPEKRIQSIEDLILALAEKADFEEIQPEADGKKNKNSKMVYLWIGIITICLVLVAVLIVQVIHILSGNNTEVPSDSEIISSESLPVSDESGSAAESDSSATSLPSVQLTNYVGKVYTEIEGELDAIVTLKKTEAFSDTVAKGTVIRQSIAAGSTVNKNTTLTLTVSKGSENFSYAGLTGKTRTLVYVRATLEAAGVDGKRITVTYENTSIQSEDGLVVRMETKKAGQISLVDNDPVVIIVAKYAAPVVSEAPEEESASNSDSSTVSQS